MNVFLSVVIPCYNEEENLRLEVLSKVANFLEKQKYSWEVIVVDDGSTDKSVSLIEQFIVNHSEFSLLKNSHQGKAATVITGLLRALGDVILFTDMDQATPIEEVNKLLPLFNQGCDIAVGSRAGKRTGAPLSRLIMARGFMLLRNLVLGLPVSDTQCGFKAFRHDLAKRLVKKVKLYKGKKRIVGSHVTAGFDVEFLFLAKKMGYKIKEVPVKWLYVETRRVNPIKDSWEGFLDLIKIKFNDLRGVYR